ncbi:MAG: cysteine desulfurase [Bacteroides sp.]|nr:cysteine desulfurase [Bacteroides sp.]
MSKTQIYFDNAASTKISDRVYEAMLPFLRESYGNPSALYSLGREASTALKKARGLCSKTLSCEQNEIFFTSGGTESDNWAIRSTAEIMREQGKNHIISSAFEHRAVLNTLKSLEKKGFEVTYLPVYENGIVKISDLEKAITDKTALVTVMYVNNEIGTVQPVSEIGGMCREKKLVFHTDAVQAAPHLRIDVERDNIDMLSISGHKLHAPKGAGLLYCRSGTGLIPMISGGGQERGLRAGTENLPAIVGLAEALTETAETMEESNLKISAVAEKIIGGVEKIKGVSLNGDRSSRIPSILNFSIKGIEGESLVLLLDLKGIACSSGSACTTGNSAPSHVLSSLGLTEEAARGSLRISLSRYNTSEEAERFIKALADIVEKLVSMREQTSL